MALPTPLAVSMLLLPVLGASTIHIKQREWISSLPGIDGKDSLVRLLLENEVSSTSLTSVESAKSLEVFPVNGRQAEFSNKVLNDSVWPEVNVSDDGINKHSENATRKCASKVPQCILMRDLDVASDQLQLRSGSFLKTGVVVLCILLVFGIILAEWMSDDGDDVSLSKSCMDFTPRIGPRLGGCQASSRSLSPGAHSKGLSPIFQSRAGGSTVLQQSCSSLNHGGNVQTKPAPIYPDLVSTMASCYAVGLTSIDCGAGPVRIHGRGQNLLLTAQIEQTGPGTGSVILTMGDARGPLLASISSAGGRLTVQDKHRRTYGKLTLVGNLAYSLTCSGVETMKIRTDSRTGKILLVNSNGGAHLASAAKLHDVDDLPSPEDYLGISVVAGMDPVLTILCIIGAMALSA